jgi:eukaryotic-like serine/threonine-protein kinase
MPHQPTSPLPAGSSDPPTVASSIELELAASATNSGNPPPAYAPRMPTVPGYEILGVLGRGGMGVVYRARQLKLNRLVALKMVLSGAHAGPRELQRFLTEAEAVAQMQHSHIVQIYEIGEHDGCPFIALEYLDGGSLAERLTGAPLPARVATRLVEQLADAMDYAHQRGILHRDLKPGNILLQFGGSRAEFKPDDTAHLELQAARAKITDFGLAKRLDVDSGQTRSGDVIGTPNYMAPEQGEGRIKDLGPATDVYSLGAILYELLTGRPPFNAESPFETVLQVINEEPVPPTQLHSKVPRDLETICLKCLQKEIPRRYASAGELAADLGRFLNQEPIRARPVRWWERAWKWAKRRPAVAALVAACCAAVVALGVVGTWAYAQQREAAARERELRGMSDLRWQLARSAVDDMYTQVAEKWLANEPQKDDLQRAFLEKARDIYQHLAEERSDDAAVRRETALASFRVGQIYRELGRREEAEAAYRPALTAQEQLVQQFPDKAEYRQDLSETANWLGELLRAGGKRLGEAEQAFRRAGRLQAELAGAYPRVPRYRMALARTHYNLGAVEMDTGRPREAGADYGTSIELLEGLRKDFPEEPDYRQELATSYTDRGLLLHETRRPEEAQGDCREAVALQKALAEKGSSPPLYRYRLAVFLNNLGLVLASGRPTEALAHHDEALQILRRLTDDFPGRPLYRYEQGNTWNFLGALHEARPDPEAAEAAWRKALELFEPLVKQHGDTPEYRYGLGQACGNLGWLHLKRGAWAEARPYLERGIDNLEIALRPNPEEPRYLDALRRRSWDLFDVLVGMGEHVSAAALVARLPGYYRPRSAGCVMAARRLVGLGAVARADRKLSDSQREDAARRYAGQALGLLREAVQGGHTTPDRLRKDPALKPLQGHPDYAKVLGEPP